MKKLIRNYWSLFIILAVVGYLFTARLGRDLLWDWDECLYAQYVKEMTRTGHYLTNIWNGYIDLQKPPFYSWLLQIPAYFGRSEFNLRLLNVVAALGLLASVYIFAKKYFGERVAILATLLLTTAEVFVIYAMRLSTDMVYSLFIFLGVWSWLNIRHSRVGGNPEKVTGSPIEPRKTKTLPYLGGFFFGLATMTKGLGTLQFLLALFVSLFLSFNKERFVDFVKMCLTYVLVVIPWHLAAYMTYGSHFIKVYVLDNIIKRSKYPIEFHRERIWFYFALIYREFFPWIFAIILFPLSVILSLAKDLSRMREPKLVGRFLTSLGMTLRKNELIYTLLFLILIPLASLTKTQTRIAWYILPVYPFLTIFLAYCMDLLVNKVAKNNTLIRNVLFAALVLFISIDSLRLILHETNFTNTTREVGPRYDVMLKARELPYTTLQYLVNPGERGAKLILPPEEQIDMTWVYGGNGCAVYYSDKKVNYYYETDKFENALKTEKGLFLVENRDKQYAEGKKILYTNPEFTLFIN